MSNFDIYLEDLNNHVGKDSVQSLVDSSVIFHHINSDHYDIDTELRLRQRRIKALLKKKESLEQEALSFMEGERLKPDSSRVNICK